MTPAELLRKARALLEMQNHWTKRAFALNAEGYVTDPTGNDAVCWCSVGAIRRVAGGAHRTAVIESTNALTACLSGRYISEFNDDPNTTHADVLAMFDRAIARAETKQ